MTDCQCALHKQPEGVAESMAHLVLSTTAPGMVPVPVDGTYLVVDGVARRVASVTPSVAVRCAYIEFEEEE